MHIRKEQLPVKNEKIWACLCHLGFNMWTDFEEKDGVKGFHFGENYEASATSRLRFQRDAWEKIVAMLVKSGCNMIILDIGEGVRFDCYPEIAAEDAWSKDELRAELTRLRGLGFEVIPKLNFSTCHDEWMGPYCRMVSTPKYYEFVKNIIAECAELFDHPRFFHIGMDEEGIECQNDYNYVVIRQGDLWWHDFNFICDCVRDAGSRPWIWADYIWDHEKIFLERMPKDVLMSNWYYGNFPDDYSASHKSTHAYELLAEHGFDQIPTGSLYFNAHKNLPKTAEFARRHFNDEHLLGFMQTIWHSTTEDHLQDYENAIKDLAETIDNWN